MSHKTGLVELQLLDGGFTALAPPPPLRVLFTGGPAVQVVPVAAKVECLIALWGMVTDLENLHIDEILEGSDLEEPEEFVEGRKAEFYQRVGIANCFNPCASLPPAQVRFASRAGPLLVELTSAWLLQFCRMVFMTSTSGIRGSEPWRRCWSSSAWTSLARTCWR